MCHSDGGPGRPPGAPGQGPESAHRQHVHVPLLKPSPTLSSRPGGSSAPASRRQWLAGALGWPLAALAGCATPWPETPTGPGSPSALARLRESALAHGLTNWQQVQDLSIDLRRSPERRQGAAAGTLQLRCLPALGLLAWRDQGLGPPQQGWRRWASPAGAGSHADRPTVKLWQAGQADSDPARLQAAASQADLLRWLLLGPMALVDTRQPVNWAEPATLEGRRCDQVTLDAPALPGDTGISRLALFIDRDQGLMRRLRVMSIAEQGQAGAQAATWDLPDPILLHGLHWPRRCQRMAPSRLGSEAANWQLVGLDLDRGLRASDVASTPMGAAATAPAAALPG